MAEGQSFLARWSRLKRAAAQPPPAPDPGPAAPPQAPLDNPPPAELPPLESLTGESDFSPFMQPDIPDAVRNAALQKLWRSDPVYANLDGLVEYGEDFAADFRSVAAVTTAYRVLQGMPDGTEQAPPEEPPSTEAAASSDPAATGNELHADDTSPDNLPHPTVPMD